MAKLLTQIWKTIHGSYFETEEEALEAERKKAFLSIIEEAHRPYIERLSFEIQQYNKLNYETKSRLDRPTSDIRITAEFIDLLYDKLREQGMLAPIILSKINENNS